MYIVSIRTARSNKTILEVAVENKDLDVLANLLESSDQVVNFKVGDGIDQSKFDFGGFNKWTTSNFP